MATDRFLNIHHNPSTPAPADVPQDLAAFLVAIDPLLASTAELARVVAYAHQSACAQVIGNGWPHARKYFSLSQKYGRWANYNVPAVGFGIHAYARKITKPLRLTDAELRSHPEWRNFGREADRHPPMRGWLVAPLIGADGENYGLIQASDRIEGDFTEQDEINFGRLAMLTSAALDALAQVHLSEYRAKLDASKQKAGA